MRLIVAKYSFIRFNCPIRIGFGGDGVYFLFKKVIHKSDGGHVHKALSRGIKEMSPYNDLNRFLDIGSFLISVNVTLFLFKYHINVYILSAFLHGATDCVGN